MNKILVGFALLCCVNVTFAQDVEEFIGAVKHLNPATFCKSVDDAKELAELYASDTKKATDLFLQKKKEAKCNTRLTPFSIIGESTLYSGTNGDIHVVEVVARSTTHFIITTMEARKFASYITVGDEYVSEVPYCNVEDEAFLLATSIDTNTSVGNAFSQKEGAPRFCKIATLRFSVLEDLSPHARQGAVHVVKVRAGESIHYVLTPLEVRNGSEYSIIPTTYSSTGQGK